MVVIIWKVTSEVDFCGIQKLGELAFGLPGSPGFLLNFLNIIQSWDYDKPWPISQLIKGNSRDLQKLLKYFHVTKTSALNSVLLLPGVLYVIFVLYSKGMLLVGLLLFLLQLSVLTSWTSLLTSSL